LWKLNLSCVSVGVPQGKLNLSCVSVGVPQDKYFLTKNKLTGMKI
jgi:hypothetical protein